ncbi:mask, partial [Symbiodinium microadriaticum]
MVGTSFTALGYTTCRIKVDVPGGAKTTQDVVAGEHLLAIPVRNCWTAASTERECPQVAQALSKAAARHPDCELLRSASTKIALHLLWERRRSPERTDATSQAEHRRAQLHLLGSPKSKKAETLLAWGRRDLESLTGSFWFEESHRRQDEIVADLQSLLTDLGPKVAAELGLMETAQDSAAILSGDVPRQSLEAYAWARWLLQEFGFRFLLPSGELLELMAPGLELVPPEEVQAVLLLCRKAQSSRRSLGPETEHALVEARALADRQPGAVLRLDVKQKGEAMLTLIAERDFKVHLNILRFEWKFLSLSGSLQPSTHRGAKNVGEGEAPSQASSPWESVEDSSESSQLWDSIEILEGALQVIEPDPETTHPDKDGEDLLEVQVCLPLGNALPSSTALEQIGLLICADADRMQKVMQVEKDILNPLGSKACRGRALSYLTRRLQWALEEYPSAAEADARALSRAAKAEAGALPRRVRGLLLVASERQLVTQAAAMVQAAIDGLASQEEEEPMAGEALPMSAEPDQGPAKAETKAPAVEEINLEDNTIYSLDWDEGEAGETGKEVAIRSPRFQSSGDRAFRATPAVEDLAARSRQRSNLKGRKPNQRGATWEDLALEQIVGFTLPVLADVTWQPGPLAPEPRA